MTLSLQDATVMVILIVGVVFGLFCAYLGLIQDKWRAMIKITRKVIYDKLL